MSDTFWPTEIRIPNDPYRDEYATGTNGFPVVAWNWRWHGKAAEVIGEKGEARRAYLEGIRLCDNYCIEDTDAADLLAELGSKP